MKQGCNPDIVAIFNINLLFDHLGCSISTSVLGCNRLWQASWENAHTHATSRLYIWERLLLHFLFPSVTQSVGEWGSYLPPSYLYSGLMGKFKFGITSDCWPEPISDNWPAPALSLSSCFEAPYNKISHSLEQAHVPAVSEILVPERAILVSHVCMHEGRN